MFEQFMSLILFYIRIVMNIPFGDLNRQYAAQKPTIDQAIQTVLNKGWFVLGEQCRHFENAFAKYCQAKQGIGVGSGTDALHLGLKACGVDAPDEVITVAHTATPTASGISLSGAKPVFIDIDPQSYTIDPNLIEQAITPHTKAIVPVHIYGQPANLVPILAIAQKHHLHVVEDCAQAHGALYQGKKAGTWGSVGCFSFYPSKNLGAFGDGGMVVTNQSQIAQKVQLLRNYGSITRDIHEIEGTNSRLDEIQAAILNAKLQYLDIHNKRRREIAHIYRTQITHPEIDHPIEKGWGTHAYHLYVIQTPHRDRLRSHLAKCGIGTGIHYPTPVHKQPAYAHLNTPPLPITEHIVNRILSLPIFPELTDLEIDHIIKSANAFCA
jgi:dTDP-4-amino-4,6-dideoxygalactose transaminase